MRTTLKRYWGYDSFLPGQEEAVQAALCGQDSLAIFPTGGGKSLTYQLPALLLDGTAVVVSPLISLMKDQVDALVGNGVAAASLNSSLDPAAHASTLQAVRGGSLKLLYVSPERLLTEDMLRLLRLSRVSFFAIDEAHCISQWGHDFRGSYRELGRLRELFPGVPIHACTATATEPVRQDIGTNLRLRNALLLVGTFDRPNLTYRLIPRVSLAQQLRHVLARHGGEAGIIYCIRKAEVDELCARLRAQGHRAVPYHAGLSAEERRANQEAFATERADVVVATVAFGMGINRSNVRFVVHAGMPRSMENYQQEAGRAGRDGLPSECVLFHSGQDPILWRTILGEPATDADAVAHAKVGEMYRFSRSLVCRHRALVEYFGQAYERGECGACDVCLGENAVLDDSFVTAQKILSCVARVRERYGARHVAEVLKGSRADKVLQSGHDRLSTYGLLKSFSLGDIGDWIDQLVASGHLARGGEYPVLSLTAAGWRLLKGEGFVALTTPRQPVAPTRRAAARPDGAPADEALFEALRRVRRRLAQERGVPPYLIFNDATLLEMCRLRPVTLAELRAVKGVGEKKAADLGPIFLAAMESEDNAALAAN